MSGSDVFGISSAETARVEAFASIDDLPSDTMPMFGPGLFSSAGWWRCVEREGLPPGATAIYLLCRIGGRAAAMLALSRSDDGTLGSLTTPYSCAFPILVSRDLSAERLRYAVRAFTGACRGSAVTRLEALDPAAQATNHLITASARAGLLALQFDHFGNWHEDVSGQNWPAYLSARPGALRSTISRRWRQAEREGAALRVASDPAGIDGAIADYEAVYARSWKPSEPFPRLHAALIRALAQNGTLRLGILDLAARAIAVQLWVVADRTATVLKLAHDQAYDALSPGTVLMAMMIRHLLDRDSPTELNFGRGDDTYKRNWARQRRQFIGVLLVNPLRPAAWPALGRHAAGRLVAAGLRFRRS